MTIWNKKKPIKCYVSYDGLALQQKIFTFIDRLFGYCMSTNNEVITQKLAAIC